MSNNVSRRSFVKGATVAAAATGISAGIGTAAASEAAPQWDYETEVLVIGYGGAGASTAIEAADNGAKVLIIEKNPEGPKHLCNSLMAGGGWHCPDPEADREALKTYLRAMMDGSNLSFKTEGEHSPLFVDEIIEKFAEYEVQNEEWLLDLDPDFIAGASSGGAAFASYPGAQECGYRIFSSSYAPSRPLYPTSDMPKEETSGGLALYNCLRTGIANRTDMISIMWETPAQELIQDESGRVIGAIAKQGDKLVRIKAKKGVALTCGGYEYNEEMRRAFLPGSGINGWTFYGTTSNTGDGIRMACKVGAQLAKVGHCSARLVWSCPDIKFNNCRVGSITPAVGSDGTLCVNSHGERFMDEVLITKDPSRYFSYEVGIQMDIKTTEYPNDPSYLIFDEEFRLNNVLVNLETSTCGFGIIPWDEKNEGPIERGWIIKGNTFQELAENIRDHEDLNGGRMEPQKFVAQVEHYQEICATGIDDQFGRVAKSAWKALGEPPYYALPIVPGGPNTKGGIQCDGSRHVIDWNNQVIPGLYSAGEMSSAFKWMYQMGGNLTENLVCGRIAGATMAAEANWDE